ncbi:MAG: hypothetical protein HGB17_19675, partial [Syntrophobacteraceae bacterium]|nr:hypothetical protein [Syntrophobacteraceae bacterium]
MERAINEIIRRHESLRTTVSTHNGEPFQIVAEALTLCLPVIDIGHEPRVAREARARALAAEISNQPFDLARGPLLRLRLIRLDPEDHILAISIHHIVADGWSLALLQEELATLYEALSKGEISALPELPMQYSDFAMWQREQLLGGLLQRQLDYWRRQLKDLTPLELPTARPRLTTRPGGSKVQVVLGAQLARGTGDEIPHPACPAGRGGHPQCHRDLRGDIPEARRRGRGRALLHGQLGGLQGRLHAPVLGLRQGRPGA